MRRSRPSFLPTPPPWVYLGQGMFYGWWIVLACFWLATLSSGVGFYGPGLFVPALAQEFGWSRSALTGAVSAYFLTSGLVGPFLGRYVDRNGPRRVMIGGALLFGCGLLALTQVTALWQLYPVWVVMAVGWAGFSGVPINTVIARWFTRRRGLAMSLAVTGFSFGGILIVPWATWMLATLGWRIALVALVLMTWAVVLPLAALVIVGRPADRGLLPDGTPEPVAAGPKAGAPDWTARAAVGTPTFWAIAAAFFLAMTATMAYITNQLAYLLEAGLSPQDAAKAVSLTASTALAGRLGMGLLSDRLPTRLVALLFFLLQSAALLTLVAAQGPTGLYLSAALFGLAMGGVGTLQPLMIAECFGVRSFGIIMGSIQFLSTLGMAVGPSVPAALYDLTGSYRPAFLALAAFGVMAAACIFFARTPQRAPAPATPGRELSRVP
ncbi:MAG: MFS transporter [Chloroflexi bacterium]|nr:MFS transporter [Chloroflexota bacterium]